jgi:prefoldin subunit 5
MTGLGYGNIVPSTTLEYWVDILIMIIGSSIYAGFFADFAVEIYNQNKKTIENEQKLEQAK